MATSGMAETSTSDRAPMTNRSIRRTPRAARAGTIFREPALESPDAPASTITVTVSLRMM